MLSHLFRSLRHRQFRLFYFGQMISITGTWMQNMAQAWLVYLLSHSTLMLGAVAFAAMLPVLLFGLAGGMLLFANTTTLTYALPLLIVLGFAVTTIATSINTLIQMQVPNPLRGRIMALFAVLFIGITSLGNLLAGYTATHLGVVTTVMLAGMICAGAGVTYRLTQVRRENGGEIRVVPPPRGRDGGNAAAPRAADD